MNDRPIVGAQKAAERLGISKVTVTRLVKRGELEAYSIKQGRSLWIDSGLSAPPQGFDVSNDSERRGP